MQVQLNIAPPANAAQAGNPSGAPASAGDASFSQLLNQAAPREPASASPSAPAPRADRPAASEDDPPCERSEKAQPRDSSKQDADASCDEGPQASADTPPVAAAATQDSTVTAPAIAPADPSLATWLATFAAAVAAASEGHAVHTSGEALVDPAAARTVQPQSTSPASGAALSAKPGAADRKPVETAAKASAAGLAQSIAHEAPLATEAPAVGQAARLVRITETQSAITDLNAPAISSLAAGSAQLVSPPANAASAATAAPTLQLPHPVGSPEFAPTLALTLTRLARDGVQEARLQLHPAEMGPIEVRIAVDGTHARVDFGADVAATRSAIEAGLPALASALRESGLTLAGGSVFQHAHHRHDNGAGDGSARRERSSDEAEAAATAPRRATRGVVDLYA